MEKFFNRTNVVLLCVLLVLCLIVAATVVVSSPMETTQTSSSANVNPKYRSSLGTGEIQHPTTVPPTTAASTEGTTTASTAAQATTAAATTTNPEATTQPTTQATATTAQTNSNGSNNSSNSSSGGQSSQSSYSYEYIQYATAIPVDTPADYEEQWDAGYIIAIDNPDKTYRCSQVTLTDDDRDLLERLCMGEFGSGGFIGACLIAQSVKDAMCFDGYMSVASVIEHYHYTGSTEVGTNQDCKNAVKYIFDQNMDAVQHRIMYMYNPSLVQSSFHESQNYILTFEGVRFFDRWGY